MDTNEYMLPIETIRDEGVYKMKNAILNEITNELNWRERIIVNVFATTFTKVYNISRIKIVNKALL